MFDPMDLLRDAARWLGFAFGLGLLALAALMGWLFTRCLGGAFAREEQRYLSEIRTREAALVGRVATMAPEARGYVRRPVEALRTAAPARPQTPAPSPPPATAQRVARQRLQHFPGYVTWHAAGTEPAQWN